MSTVAEFEPFVDSTIRTFFARLDGFAAKGNVFDISTWLQYCKASVLSTGCWL